MRRLTIISLVILLVVAIAAVIFRVDLWPEFITNVAAVMVGGALLVLAYVILKTLGV